MKNSVPYIITGAVATLAIQALLRRNQKTHEVTKALDRLKKNSGSIRVLPPKDLVSLVEALELLKVLEPLKELKEALEVVDISQDVRDAMGTLDSRIQSSLMHPDSPPERDDSDQSNSELDWIAGLFPPSSRPSFFILTPPSPADALERIDRQGIPPASTITSDQTITNPDGSTTRQTTSESSDGSTKETSITRDIYGTPIASRAILRDSNGSKTEVIQWQEGGLQIRHVYKDGSHQVFTRAPVGPNEPWRRVPDERQRGGAHTGGLIEHLPTEDEIQGNPQFILMLNDGRFAQCVFLNPVTGMSYCRVLGRDEVNIDSDHTPIIDATDMIIGEDDWVVNPGPDIYIPRGGTPSRIPGHVGPGVRPPEDLA